MSMKKVLGVAVVLVATSALAGCDQSKPELESTRKQLQTVTMERDGLKTQLAEAQQRAVVLQQRVADISAKLSAAAADLVPPAGEAKPETAKGEKKAAGANKPAPAKPAPTPAP